MKIAKGDAYKRSAAKRRHIRIRKKVSGTPERPRLVVTRTNRGITAQVIDDLAGHTLASASHLDGSVRGGEGGKSAQAQ
ncbi:50S ribosomal protein L18, partial [Streptomyces nanshensis]